MTPCWPPGALRAHLDGELAPGDAAQLAAHLELCPACSAQLREIAARAECVTGLLRALEPAPRARRRRLALPRRLAAGAIAAACALLLLPSRPPAPHRTAATLQPFIALDNDPIDTGLVVRVALGPDRIPADIIVGSDGRPHAYRLVSNFSEGVKTE
ncbi:MAG TPA: zf-HC2 domain-containing protein [Bryobacteraceae bacterium]|jgi:anti-sigma factor RsiW|nr:zf-HC2 domain-containing protein [Bryobacteraceae bacterium]